MGIRDPRIDRYIANAAPFARPVLTELRDLVHETCPRVQETLKWGMPSFMHHGILCGMAAFQAHATFGFWKGKLIVDAKSNKNYEAMGQFGRITKMGDLPSKRVLAGYIRQAMKLNEEGVRVPRAATTPKKPIAVPGDLRVALAKSAKAKKTFDDFTPSHRREYLEWITEAKRVETRKKRIAQTVEWLAAGRRRNWKYEG
jgi:uncharacterized protein YdeI (YjbR/CyaY-like superfamily)